MLPLRSTRDKRRLARPTLAAMVESFDEVEFARAFERFLHRFNELIPPGGTGMREAVMAHLGADPAGLSSFTERFDASEHANLQLALDRVASESPASRLLGLPSELLHFGNFSFGAVLTGRFHGPTDPVPPEFVNVPVDVDRSLPCVRLGVYLLELDGDRIAVLLGVGEDHGPRSGLLLDVVAADAAIANRFVVHIRALMHELNIYRGKILSFSFSEWGRFGVQFHELPNVKRDDIVLPPDDLAAIEAHTVRVSRHADRLRRAGQHLKRGLLLYGPPGTGKTLSVMYLCGQMSGRTTLLLSGPGAGALGQAIAIARALQPSMVVLEDVDLVAYERTMPGMGTNPLLFQLLNDMDGLAADADVVFVLTSNRVDLLEPALAARPGRIDQAVEIGLPDASCRTRLLDLYLADLGLDAQALGDVVDRSEGVSAAFIKELARRAALIAADRDPEATKLVATPDDVRAALDDLLHHSAPVLRSALGANPGVAFSGPVGGQGFVEEGGASGGWFAFGAGSGPDDEG
jgi:hypothetical protein